VTAVVLSAAKSVGGCGMLRVPHLSAMHIGGGVLDGVRFIMM
jgi:hypothetical protein